MPAVMSAVSGVWRDPGLAGIAPDLDVVVERTEELWKGLHGSKVLLTGATGFFGAWLLGSLCRAVDRLGVDVEALVLTRGPDGAGAAAPALLAHPAVRLVTGDVRTVHPPMEGVRAAVLGAVPTGGGRGRFDVVTTIVDGTRRMLDAAAEAGVARCLVISSGAVYGPRGEAAGPCREEDPTTIDPTDTRFAYAESKRVAELLAALATARGGPTTVVARCFAFVGPYLPLDGQFAVGNFISDSLAGRAIRIRSTGDAVRSYLHAADLAAWLWTLLERGDGGRAYNLGAEQPVRIADLATEVASCSSPAPAVVVEGIAGSDSPTGDWYVPSTARARNELGLTQTIDRLEAIRRTVSWHRHTSAAR